jgi:peptide/nickel transport system ATP-binding protein/oligopeptide transport system ATP-binding protein
VTAQRGDVILRVENLVKEFPIRRSRDVVHAVTDVSFEVRSGETLALVGESGSGKTTVGRCLLKLEQPTSGRIEFHGRDIVGLSAAEFRKLRPRIQMVFQEPQGSLNPQFTIMRILEENLYLEGALSAAERKQRVRELLAMTRLPADILDVYAHELTGGVQQRVSIARALSTRPDLIVLDEPTSALDISVRADIIRLLEDLQEESNISYLFISHDLTAVKQISHRVAIMYLGEIVEVAPNPGVFDYQLHPYGQALLSSVLLPDPSSSMGSVTLKGEIPSPVHLPTACPLHPRCPFVLEVCREIKPQLAAFGERRLAACHRADEFVDGGRVSANVGDRQPAERRRDVARWSVGRSDGR